MDIILTNVSIPDLPFTGCGAEVAKRLGIQPSTVYDLHNHGCVAFVSMIPLAQSLMTTMGAKKALLCNVQTGLQDAYSHTMMYVLPRRRFPVMDVALRCSRREIFGPFWEPPFDAILNMHRICNWPEARVLVGGSRGRVNSALISAGRPSPRLWSGAMPSSPKPSKRQWLLRERKARSMSSSPISPTRFS